MPHPGHLSGQKYARFWARSLASNWFSHQRATSFDGARRSGARRPTWSVAINAGMFSSDGLSSVGYLRAGEHINNCWDAGSLA